MNKYGQSIVEYALIAILVLFGVVFMSTYVLRSVNAHFKLWDEGVQDTFDENIRQAPVNDVPFINVNCQCTPSPGNCGSVTAGGSLCGPSDREIDISCNYPGCLGAAGNATCEYDSSCCSTMGQAGCGSAPLPNVGIGTTCPSGVSGPCYQALTTGPSPCYYGQQVWAYSCPSANPDVCTNDTASCPLPTCTASALFSDSFSYCATSSCPYSGGTCPAASCNNSNAGPLAYPTSYTETNCSTGGSYSSVTLNLPTPVSYVGNSYSDCTGGICDVYCNPPYIYSTKLGYCVLQFNVAAVSCSAATNFPPSSCSGTCHAGSSSSCRNCSCPAQPSVQCPNGGTCVVTENIQDFVACALSSTIITSVSEDPSAPTATPSEGIPGTSISAPCGDPGEPSQTCDVEVFY